MNGTNHAPTTEQVREVFRFGLLAAGERINVAPEAALERFDSWLTTHNAQVWEEGHASGTLRPEDNPYRPEAPE